MYVLDTNTVIDLFKGRGRVADKLFAIPPADIAIPSIVLFELELGAEKSDRPEAHRSQVDQLLRLVTLLPFSADEAKSAARVRAGLEAAGHPIGPYDTLIAATALAHGATLVTHNTDEFQRVEGLQVEDWF